MSKYYLFFTSFFKWFCVVPLVGAIPYLIRLTYKYFYDNLDSNFIQQEHEIIGLSIALIAVTFYDIKDGTGKIKNTKVYSAICTAVLGLIITLKVISLNNEQPIPSMSINQYKIFIASVLVCISALIINFVTMLKNSL